MMAVMTTKMHML